MNSRERELVMKRLQIFGVGCPKCRKLAENAEMAAKALGIEYTLEKITDIDVIAGSGVMLTPALMVDGQVKIAGQAADVDTIKKLLG